MKKEIFISHSWGLDSENRDNHKRVMQLFNLLKNLGYSVWIDENEINGNIDNCIINGINNCNIVLICLSEKYIEKINNSIINETVKDNCYKEWNYTLFKNKKIIPIIMDSASLNIINNNSGVIQMYLNNLIYIEFFKEKDEIEENLKILCNNLYKKQIYNYKQKTNLGLISNISFDKFLNALYNLSPRKLTSPNKNSKKKITFNIERYNKSKINSIFNYFNKKLKRFLIKI